MTFLFKKKEGSFSLFLQYYLFFLPSSSPPSPFPPVLVCRLSLSLCSSFLCSYLPFFCCFTFQCSYSPSSTLFFFFLPFLLHLFFSSLTFSYVFILLPLLLHTFPFLGFSSSLLDGCDGMWGIHRLMKKKGAITKIWDFLGC